MSTFTQTTTSANANANASTPVRRPIRTMEERKAKSYKSEAWNGKQKYGSYARHRQVMESAATERKAFKDAENAGEFVPARRGRKKQNAATTVVARCLPETWPPTMPRILPRFATLVDDDSDDEETSQLPVITTPTKPRTEPTPVTPRQVSWGPLSVSAIVTPTTKRIGLKNGSWADECDSDDEE